MTTSAVAVESFPPLKERTICSSSKFLQACLINVNASFFKNFNRFLFALTKIFIFFSNLSYPIDCLSTKNLFSSNSFIISSVSAFLNVSDEIAYCFPST